MHCIITTTSLDNILVVNRFGSNVFPEYSCGSEVQSLVIIPVSNNSGSIGSREWNSWCRSDHHRITLCKCIRLSVLLIANGSFSARSSSHTLISYSYTNRSDGSSNTSSQYQSCGTKSNNLNSTTTRYDCIVSSSNTSCAIYEEWGCTRRNGSICSGGESDVLIVIDCRNLSTQDSDVNWTITIYCISGYTSDDSIQLSIEGINRTSTRDLCRVSGNRYTVTNNEVSWTRIGSGDTNNLVCSVVDRTYLQTICPLSGVSSSPVVGSICGMIEFVVIYVLDHDGCICSSNCSISVVQTCAWNPYNLKNTAVWEERIRSHPVFILSVSTDWLTKSIQELLLCLNRNWFVYWAQWEWTSNRTNVVKNVLSSSNS